MTMPGLCAATNEASKRCRTLLRRAHDLNAAAGFIWVQVMKKYILERLAHLLSRNEWRQRDTGCTRHQATLDGSRSRYSVFGVKGGGYC